ncbi:MAG: endonuclease/exonuclease/phosphatase family protein, partial [Planctomycetes bacterium]|nr:endonuclease/exonuclease/phosphatase family protein [Planctomycetota bacterium]
LLWCFVRTPRRRAARIWALVLIGAGLFGLAPALSLFGSADDVAGEAPELRIGSVNLLFGISHPEPVGAWIGEEGLDVVGFVEVKDSPRSKLNWPKLLESWRGEFPYQVVEPHPYFGMALISKRPLSEAQTTFGLGGHGEESERPMRLEATVQFEGRPVRLCLVHPPRPDSSWRGRVRPIFFDSLATEMLARRLHNPEEALVVFGDMNATEGSPLFQTLVRRLGLRDSRQGLGYMPSWRPQWFWLPVLPLDHILVRGLEVKARGVGSSVRSDHWPIQATLSWPKREPSDPTPR